MKTLTVVALLALPMTFCHRAAAQPDVSAEYIGTSDMKDKDGNRTGGKGDMWRQQMPGVEGLSASNIRYTKRFYLLYYKLFEDIQQLAGDSDGKNFQQVAENLFSIPWGHHLFLIDKCGGDAVKAYFYVRQTVENA